MNYNEIMGIVTAPWLQAEMKARAIDVKDLAAMADLSQSAIYEILNEVKNRPNTVGRVKIFLALYPHPGK